MRVIAIDRFGGPEELSLRDVPKPTPGENEVLIRVAYAGVNPVDWKIREGYLKDFLPHEFPLIPGWDAAGEVAEVGGSVKSFQPGDLVYAYCRKPVVQWGTYAEYIAVPESSVARAPANLSMAEAAVVPLAALTAFQSLALGKITRGQKVLIHAGAGGVGGFAIQLAKVAGATVTTTASVEKQGYVIGLGADFVVDYRKEQLAEAARRLAPGGFDFVFDTVGAETLRESYRVVKPHGMLVSIVEEPSEAVSEEHGIRSHYVFVSPNGAQLLEITRLIESRAVKAPHVEIFPLTKAAIAHQKSQSHRTLGKIVLQVNLGNS